MQYIHCSLICVNNVSFNVYFKLDFIHEVEIKAVAVRVNSQLGICGQPMLLYIQDPDKDMTYLHIDPKRFQDQQEVLNTNVLHWRMNLGPWIVLPNEAWFSTFRLMVTMFHSVVCWCSTPCSHELIPVTVMVSTSLFFLMLMNWFAGLLTEKCVCVRESTLHCEVPMLIHVSLCPQNVYECSINTSHRRISTVVNLGPPIVRGGIGRWGQRWLLPPLIIAVLDFAKIKMTTRLFSVLVIPAARLPWWVQETVYIPFLFTHFNLSDVFI